MDAKNILSLSYTRRLSRPGVSYLNPYVREEEPFSKSHGNPDLRTVVSDALTLTYRTNGEKWNLMTRVYGIFCNNKIEYLSSIGADGIKLSTYENAARYNPIDATVDFDWSHMEKLGLQAAAQLGYDFYYAPSLDQKNGGIDWTVSLSGDALLWWGMRAYASAYATGGEISLLRTYHGADYNYSLGIRREFLQNRSIMSLMAIMPFQGRYDNTERDTDTGSYHQHNESWYNPRQFHLGLIWRFGKTSVNLRHVRKTTTDDKL